MANQHLFARGRDNQAGLAALHTLAPPLFRRYRMDLLTEWAGQVEIVPDANLNGVRIGPPSVVVILPVVVPDELELLRTTFFDGQALQTDVTVQTLDKDVNVFLPFNGVLRWPQEKTWDRGAWRDVRLPVTDLVLISGFSNGFDVLAFGG
jgi:hypothetical protein